VAAELTAVVFALSREAAPFLKRRRLNPHGPRCQARDDLLVLRMGDMGAEAAARATDQLLQARPDVRRVISAGFCGGLVQDARVGDVVLGSDSLVTVDRPVVTVAERRALHAATGARVVDMESAVIARRCAVAGVAFESVRVVSDDLEHPLPADLMPALSGEQIVPHRLLAAVWRRPGLVADLWRLAKYSRLAANRLAGALDEYLR
jgi:nucleoside phosphorylase